MKGYKGFRNFKFQSDSINTMAGVDLIVMLVTFKFQSDSINTKGIGGSDAGAICFKFQSDSINTWVFRELCADWVFL